MNQPPADSDPYRLPRHARPRRYDVRLAPDLEAGTFTGHVRITLDVREAGITSLVLNAAELDVQSATLDGHPLRFHLDPPTERLHLTAGTELAPGLATLELTFGGVLNDRLRGFYRSTYRDADGVTRVIAATQCQATDCRRIFPCWDEPDFKAVFGVTLDVADGLLAVSNGAEVSRTVLDDGGVRVEFADTIPMSTYLFAAVVGPLEATEPVLVGATPVRVVHVPGEQHLTPFALDAATFSLGWFQDYYGIPYPGDKLDLVALPDFAAGAMENLGCVTFRETLLLIDPDTSTQLERQRVADVVAHELAHMWFGDLVTMRWWNGIWLNEAFATFMELAACDAYRPDWHRWDTFGRERSLAFEADALESTRPVEYDVRSPDDCQGMFDVLTYQKGGALLRMLEQYLGPEHFRRGVSYYLSSHELGNTETSDLWDAIEEATDQPVRRLMDSWIWQRGFPLVNASLDGDHLVLHQERFRYPGGSDAADATTWVVPVHVRFGTDTTAEPVKVLLDGPTARIPLPSDLPPDGPIVVNAGGVGFYRVMYDDELRSRVHRRASLLTSLERYCLVDDTWSAVVADRLEASAFLELAFHLRGETDTAVWQALGAGLRGCGRLLDRHEQPPFASIVRRLVRPSLAGIGWDPTPGEDELTAQLREVLVPLLAVLGDDRAAQDRCRVLATQAWTDPHRVQADLTAAAVTVVASVDGQAAFDRHVQAMREARTPQEQLRYLYALAEPDDPELVRRACELAFSDEVRSQNAPFLLQRCIANRWHGDVAWKFVRTHWADALQRFPSNTLVRMVDAVKLLDRRDLEADVQAFFREHPLPNATATLAQVLERQGVNVALREREDARFPKAILGHTDHPE